MRARWIWLGAAVLMVIGLCRLRFDVEVMNLLPGELPVVKGLRLYQENFANAQELIITLKGEDAEGTEALARDLAAKLRAQSNLTGTVFWQPPWLEHPGQSAELIAYLWLNQPPATVRELSQRLTPTNLAPTLISARNELATSMSPGDIARLSYDPYGLTRLPESVSAAAPAFTQGQELFASADGTFRILFVQAHNELKSYRDCAHWLAQVKDVVTTTAGGAKVKIGYTGRPAFVAEIAGGMERDMGESVVFTALIIAILFWFAHRRLTPMLWLLTLLALILAGTLALGGLLFGTINVVSLGFAAILLGLAVDYGVVHYQEALASPNAIIPEIRRAIGPSIFWAAVTTISAFLVLNFGGLPGLAQLGSLVAVGVALSALVMLFAFLPPLFRDRMAKRREQLAAGIKIVQHAESGEIIPVSPGQVWRVFIVTGLVLLVAAVVLVRGLPQMDHTANALRPRNSPSYAALDEIKAQLTQNREPLWIVSTGKSETEVAQRLTQANAALTAAVSNRWIAGFTLPNALWPQPANQSANRAALQQILQRRELMNATLVTNGFTTNSFVLAENIFGTWTQALATTNVFWPTNEMSRWILGKLTARPQSEFLAVGLVYPAGKVTPESVAQWSGNLAQEGFLVSGWELLGGAILKRVQGNLWFVVLPMVLLVFLSLWLAFRRATEILLSLAVLSLSGVCLLAMMHTLNWSWNLLNLMALPLMLGTGVDYSIFMQLALRRHHGDLPAAHRSVGRALLLCGGTAVAGFGSLSFSSNAGMASLGQVCAVGVGCNMLISIYLLPIWWWQLRGEEAAALVPESNQGTLVSPSALYGAFLWRAALVAVRVLPAKILEMFAQLGAFLYWSMNLRRREVVMENLLPLTGDRLTAEQTGSRLAHNFAQKLCDLWRYESGQETAHLFDELTGWEHFQSAQRSGRGILLITPHLGNWEFGAPLLARRGVKLLVLTQAEPGDGLTELRQASRARWGIETLVVGQDPFAFVEIIKRLQAGAVVALLVDRPPEGTGAEVSLFGRPFHASVAAAELARASNCVLLPVSLPRGQRGYAAHILPEIPYDRAALGNREARIKLTQEIMRAFEPVIRQYPDQWYHFVSIWPSR